MSIPVAPKDKWDAFLTIAATVLLVVEIFCLIRAPGSAMTIIVAILLIAAGVTRVFRYRYLKQQAGRNGAQ